MVKFLFRIRWTVQLFFIYLYCLVVSSYKLIAMVFTHGMMRGNVEEINLEGMTQWQVFFLSHMITMTPGTTVCGVSKELDSIEIFTVFKMTPEELKKDVELFGKPLRKIFS